MALAISSDAVTDANILERTGAASKDLYHRLALFAVLENRRRGHERRTPSGNEITEARRNFMDSLAYLCDVRKGGGTVTAIGLQRLDLGNMLWMAANEGITKEIKDYTQKILDIARNKNLSPQHAENVILELAVQASSHRISTYRGELQKHTRRCIKLLREQGDNAFGMS